jgi:hypothetical protein
MLYQERPRREISNLYTVKIVNKTRKELPVELRIENMKGRVVMVGKPVTVKSEGVSAGQFFAYLNQDELKKRKTKIYIGVYSNGKRIKTVKTSFFAPFKRETPQQ